MKIIKQRYSIEPKNRIYVEGYGFLSFVKNMGNSLRNKYSQKLLNRAKKSTMDAIKTASEKAIQKTTEATSDLTGNKIADKITSVSKNPPKKLQKDEIEEGRAKPKDVPKNKDAYLQKKDNKLLMN